MVSKKFRVIPKMLSTLSTVIILGYALQYLFLTTFALMTCMSCELLMNLRYFLALKSITKLYANGANHVQVNCDYVHIKVNCRLKVNVKVNFNKIFWTILVSST